MTTQQREKLDMLESLDVALQGIDGTQLHFHESLHAFVKSNDAGHALCDDRIKLGAAWMVVFFEVRFSEWTRWGLRQFHVGP